MLPSWNEGTVKTGIVDFVSRVTREGGKDYLPPARRIAVFDNDGTLWTEQPMQPQLFFLADRVKALAAKDPPLAQRQPFKALLEHDLATLHALGKKAVMELFAATHAGMSEEQFEDLATSWFSSAKHPKFGRLFKECTFQPQVELLGFLRENGFRNYIVSGGGIDLIRAFSADAYGIPREQVIGSSAKLRFDSATCQLMKEPQLNSFDDREAKPQNIGLHIGQRPILAFGNSDGDQAMLRYVRAHPCKGLALLLHHDDAAREVAYDRDFRLSPLTDTLDRAEELGITVVSMKRDWKRVIS